ncbi:UBN2_3 domain-containing protein [Cephalotus follicularis]|uniref:UBN2_3 domain-containing protein n=1 Tax=Cephalotus follicularis TaxID=3775 RepID=A0A1Q3BZL3_CEPFO|nr:UBN2_3 domain-containing protein [Cephalotus follicularis]
MVMSWLINSMTNNVGDNFIFYETAQETWEAVREAYSDTEDAVEAFKIEGILHDFRQGDLPVTQYFNHLTRYWQQQDMYETTKWDCPTDAAKYTKIVEKNRTYKFLVGLKKT